MAEIANYKEQLIVDYQENPLIEALPPIFNEENFIEAVTEYPNFSESERELDASLRFHLISRLARYFQPLGEHIDLERKISRIIRQGYLMRNPLSPLHAIRLQENRQAMKRSDDLLYPPPVIAVSSRVFRSPQRVGQVCNLPRSHRSTPAAGYKPALRQNT
jgi:hypothetical protein